MVVTYGDPQAAMAAEHAERIAKVEAEAVSIQEEQRRKWREAKQRQKAAKQAAPQTTTSGTATSGSTVTYVPPATVESGEKVQEKAAKEYKKKGKRGRPRGTKYYRGSDKRLEPHPYRLSGIKTKEGQDQIVKAGVETVGRGVSRLTTLGSVPQYVPPDMSVKGKYYKYVEYKPVESGPIYRPIKYQYTSAEPMFKQFQPYRPVDKRPYYRKSEYQPIGQFGGVIGPVPPKRPTKVNYVMTSEGTLVPKKRKRRYKRKEPRLTGV